MSGCPVHPTTRPSSRSPGRLRQALENEEVYRLQVERLVARAEATVPMSGGMGRRKVETPWVDVDVECNGCCMAVAPGPSPWHLR